MAHQSSNQSVTCGLVSSIQTYDQVIYQALMGLAVGSVQASAEAEEPTKPLVKQLQNSENVM